jgi:L-lactate dehydrogenase
MKDLLQPIILVVDDEIGTQRLFQSELGNCKYLKLEIVATGKEAIAYAEAHDVSVAFVDVGLPDINGLDVAEKLLESKRNRAIQIAIITVQPTKPRRDKARKLGIKLFLGKTHLEEQIYPVLTQLLDNWMRKSDQLVPIQRTDYARVVEPIRCLHIEGNLNYKHIYTLGRYCSEMALKKNGRVIVEMGRVTGMHKSAIQPLGRLINLIRSRRLSGRLVFASVPVNVLAELRKNSLEEHVNRKDTLEEALRYVGVEQRHILRSLTPSRVAIIGPGEVGSAVAYELARSGLVSKISFIGRRMTSGGGEKLDLLHCAPEMPELRNVTFGSYESAEEADIVVVTAGEKVGRSNDRAEVAIPNAHKMRNEILNQLRHTIFRSNPGVKVIVIDNPVDIITLVAVQSAIENGYLKNPTRQIMGTGTLVDTLRLQSYLMELTGHRAEQVQGIVLGEHGENMVPMLSSVRLNGQRWEDHPLCWDLDFDAVRDDLRTAAADVKAWKEIDQNRNKMLSVGTRWAVAVAVRKLVESLMRHETTVLPVTAYLGYRENISELELEGPICMSLPFEISDEGINSVSQEWQATLYPREINELRHAAGSIYKLSTKIIGSIR